MANDITILSCPQCGFPKIRDCGNGLYQCDDCGTHFDKSENIVLTNEEWFCSLPTYKKAILMANCYDAFNLDQYACNKHVVIEDWLKEKHHD